MPLPKPRKNEKKTDFLSRCMGNETSVSDFPDNAQRYAVCNTQWASAKKDGSYEDAEEKACGDDKKKKDKVKAKKRPGCAKAVEAAENAKKTAEKIVQRYKK